MPVEHSSAELLDLFPKSIDLGLRPDYLMFLERLGNPHHKIPPVFHVAGTNGKGSTCAFLRSCLEAAGYKVHVYTSPHLVAFHERIRLAGKLIEEGFFAEILSECWRLSQGTVTVFEALTAASFLAFSQIKADFSILEVGLGGRLDATNVIDQPLACLIARLSYDHRQHLGNHISQIAREKAGIMKRNVPCFVAPQPDPEALATLKQVALEKEAPLWIGGEDWRVEAIAEGFRYKDRKRSFDLPYPSLLGDHQFYNAGLALSALSILPTLPVEALAKGMTNAEWPARLQLLTNGKLKNFLPPTFELWLDGGHNDSAGEVLAHHMQRWQREDGGKLRPLHIIAGMLSTKVPGEFLAPIVPYATSFTAVPIPNETLSLSATSLAASVQGLGLSRIKTETSICSALQNISVSEKGSGRVLICGSLYLAGAVLKDNGNEEIIAATRQ